MAHITLVRHGQANSGSQDEHSYDKLSDLGHEQATWLGEHLRATHQVFDSVYCGTMRRHVETAHGMNAQGFAPIVSDARLNELSYFELAEAYCAWSGAPHPKTRDEFVEHMPKLSQAWKDGKLQGIPESYAAFEDRISAALADIAAQSDRALVVTSGGVIGMLTRQIMDMDVSRFARTTLSIMNTSVHRIVNLGGNLSLTQFNNIAHLEDTGRHHAQTYI
ncbi:MAG: histidine phosphatase family protein [Pseudomonadota bacterium]